MAEQPKAPFDLFYPSPPPLTDLACIRVALDVWIGTIIKCRQNCDKFDLSLDSILPLNTIIPNAPPGIRPQIEKYAGKFINSVNRWLKNHHEKGIIRSRSSYDIFRRFVDFVCDYDGTIDCEKTTRKMIVSDAFSVAEKFKMACEYGLVDDIERIWPDVPASVYEDDKYVHRNRVLYYWIWRFRGQLYKMGEFKAGGLAGTQDFLFDQYVMHDYWCGVDYCCSNFDSQCLDRIKTNYFFNSDKKRICRYLLVKLNEAQLHQWVNGHGVNVLRGLLDSEYSMVEENTFVASHMWNYTKHVITKDAFIRLIHAIVVNSTWSHSCAHNAEIMSSWNEIWSSAPDYLKQSVIPDVLKGLADSTSFIPDSRPFIVIRHLYNNFSLLSTILKECPIEYRKAFWGDQWQRLIINTDVEKLENLMNVCFANEDEIKQFKKSNMAQFENIRGHCLMLLNPGRFQELLEFLRFCYTDDELVRIVSRTLLESHFKWTKIYLYNTRALDEFISFAFADVGVELARHFRGKRINPVEIVEKSLLMGPVHRLGGVGIDGNPATFKQIMDFFDIFVTSKEMAKHLKKTILVPRMKVLITAIDQFGNFFPKYFDEGFAGFMNWCLENDEDEIARFKETVDLDEIIQARIRAEVGSNVKVFARVLDLNRDSGGSRSDYHGLRPPKMLKLETNSIGSSFLPSFVRWYCVTAEKLEAVRRRYDGDHVFVELMSI